MRLSGRSSLSHAIRNVGRINVVLATVGTAALLCGVTFLVVLKLRLSRESSATVQAEVEARKARQELAAIAALPKVPDAVGLAAVSQFQSGLAHTAQRFGCDIRNFQSGSDIGVFVTRYAKNTLQKDWGQIPVRATLEGSLRDVLDAIAALKAIPVPVEIDTLTFTRRSVNSAGRSTVTAHIELRVLSQPKVAA